VCSASVPASAVPIAAPPKIMLEFQANASVVVPVGASRSTSWKTQVSTGGRPTPLSTASGAMSRADPGVRARRA
jgi:hypothetical protein